MRIYGYKVENKKVVIDTERAEIVRYIFEQYSLGVYVKDIIDTLTAKGVLNRGKPFARNTVYNILKNEKYSGIYHYKDQEFDNIYPQIVPMEIFERVRAKMNANKYGSRSVEIVYLLRHKARMQLLRTAHQRGMRHFQNGRGEALLQVLRQKASKRLPKNRWCARTILKIL